jgi:hypothetical protein
MSLTCNADDIQGLDAHCQDTLAAFKQVDPNAVILPGIGLPSQGNGVCTITHGMPGAPKMSINGLTSNSALANNALFSSECSGGQYLNLYEMMLPDGRRTDGQRSAAQTYHNALAANGLDVSSQHVHWSGMDVGGDPLVFAIHHQNVGLDPVDFAQRTVDALQIYNSYAGMH